MKIDEMVREGAAAAQRMTGHIADLDQLLREIDYDCMRINHIYPVNAGKPGGTMNEANPEENSERSSDECVDQVIKLIASHLTENFKTMDTVSLSVYAQAINTLAEAKNRLTPKPPMSHQYGLWPR